MQHKPVLIATPRNRAPHSTSSSSSNSSSSKLHTAMLQPMVQAPVHRTSQTCRRQSSRNHSLQERLAWCLILVTSDRWNFSRGCLLVWLHISIYHLTIVISALCVIVALNDQRSFDLFNDIGLRNKTPN